MNEVREANAINYFWYLVSCIVNSLTSTKDNFLVGVSGVSSPGNLENLDNDAL